MGGRCTGGGRRGGGKRDSQGSGKRDSQGSGKREKKGKITQHCAIFRNRINAKGREPKNTGREPGLKGTGSGRFKPPCPPPPPHKQVSSWQPRPRWSAGTLPVHLCGHVHTTKCWLQQEYRHHQYPRDVRADHKVKTVWLCDLYLLSGKLLR